MARPAHVDLAIATAESYDAPTSAPWGPDMPNPAISAVEDPTQDSFYRSRDAMVGGTRTVYNTDPRGGANGQSGANWGSLGDVVPVVNSDSGLGGPIDDDGAVWTPGTRFSDVLSASDLSEGAF